MNIKELKGYDKAELDVEAAKGGYGLYARRHLSTDCTVYSDDAGDICAIRKGEHYWCLPSVWEPDRYTTVVEEGQLTSLLP